MAAALTTPDHRALRHADAVRAYLEATAVDFAWARQEIARRVALMKMWGEENQ